ncbi:MAG TPA: helix-turn-helix domain-containing protein [Ramlibacter sp.]|nr:helix-turn-helix domain-containing protein [Ramlibacter sp.]
MAHPNSARKASHALGPATRKPKSGAMAAILEAAGDLERAGLISKKTMRDYEELCTAPPSYTAKDVARIRERLHARQSFFARSLNVSPSAVQQWESGAKRPSGAAAKLLAVVEKHGLEVLA